MHKYNYLKHEKEKRSTCHIVDSLRDCSHVNELTFLISLKLKLKWIDTFTIFIVFFLISSCRNFQYWIKKIEVFCYLNIMPSLDKKLNNQYNNFFFFLEFFQITLSGIANVSLKQNQGDWAAISETKLNNHFY